MSARPKWLIAIGIAVVVLGLAWFFWNRTEGEDPVTEFCVEFAHLLRVDQISFEVDPGDDIETRNAMDRTARQFADAAAAAPPQIQPDVQLLADLTEALSDAVAETSSRQTFDRAAALIAAQDPYLETQDAAAQRVLDYVTRHCTAAPG